MSAFTDERGRFLIEGLAPGDYLIWAGPMIRLDAHSELLARGATLDARDVFSLDPLSVPVNRAPHATVVIPSVTLTAGDAATLNLASYFSDQDNGPLKQRRYGVRQCLRERADAQPEARGEYHGYRHGP